MRISEKAIDFIKKQEELRLKMYKDVAGIPTIGYGHVVQKNEEYLNTKTLTALEAEQILANDLRETESYINHICLEYNLELTQNQFDALLSFCFNTGCFTDNMLERLRNKDLQAVGKSLTLYNKSGGKVREGLTNRRKAEQAMFFTN